MRSGTALLARSMKSLAASDSSPPLVPGGSPSGGTGNRCSLESRSSAWLVTRNVSPGASASSSLTTGAAARSCSKLSSTTRHRRDRKWSRRTAAGGLEPTSRTPTDVAIAGSRCPGSVTDASGTNQTPSRNSSSTLRAASKASRDFPIPAGPTSVTRRDERTSSATCRTSRRRPMKDVNPIGRLPRSAMLCNGGKSLGSPAMSSWNRCSGSMRSLSRCGPRSRTVTPSGRRRSTSARVPSEMTTCPPWAAAAMRAARWTSNPT